MQNMNWKRLKQKIRRRFNYQNKLVWGIFRISALTIVFTLYCLGNYSYIAEARLSPSSLAEDDMSTWFAGGKELRAIYHKKYVCGEEISDLNHVTYEDAVMMSKQNPNWKITVDQQHTIIRFEEQINDLSPYCKENAFFGIDDEGQFSLYDGKPIREKVIRTFFQLNLPYLESKLPEKELEHLQVGIKVRDIDEYDSVLSTFNEYRLDRIMQ